MISIDDEIWFDLICNDPFLDKNHNLSGNRTELTQPPFITQSDLDKWWSKQKEILLVEFEKIIKQKINEYNNINRERQTLHL